MSWLSKGIVSAVLSDLACCKRPPAHEALDELPDIKVVKHISSVLVAASDLPNRDDQMVRLERHVKDLVASHASPGGRQILHRYATWHLIRRLRRRSRGNDITHTQLNIVRVHLRAAAYLLDWLTDQALASCQQSFLERWMTRDETQLKRNAGHFVRWALAQRITRDLSFPAVKWNDPSQAMGDDPRRATARRLLHDDTIRAEGRLAGLLLLLYTRWPAAISQLTTTHIEDGRDSPDPPRQRRSFLARPHRRSGPGDSLRPSQPHGPRPGRIPLALPRRPARSPFQGLGNG
ncbi:hypothetical protein [Streptomyces sp. NPDC004589]|uniref:hypothetical protein n=1 Tax=Streptomyces sp. NPDC004589 TaxID=3154553 RepID=UPI0033AC881F